MRTVLLMSALVALLGCDALDRVSTKQPAPVPSARSAVDSGRVTIRGSSTASEGDSVNLTAEVAHPRGELEYEWSLSGRGSMMSRETDPQNVVVIASTTGRLLVTVTVTEDGDAVGSANLTLRSPTEHFLFDLPLDPHDGSLFAATQVNVHGLSPLWRGIASRSDANHEIQLLTDGNR